MLTTWYRVRWGRIETVAVERETNRFLIIEGRRNAKRGGWENYFTTWQEAKAFSVRQARDEVDNAKRSLARAEGRLADIEASEELKC